MKTDEPGPLPPAPTQERRFIGAANIPTIYEVFRPFLATLPDGSVVKLPIGTVLTDDASAASIGSGPHDPDPPPEPKK